MIQEKGTGNSPEGGVIRAGCVDAEELLENPAAVLAGEATPDVSAAGAEVRKGASLPAKIRPAGVVAERAQVSVSVMERCSIDLMQRSVRVSPVFQAPSPCERLDPSDDAGTAARVAAWDRASGRPT